MIYELETNATLFQLHGTDGWKSGCDVNPMERGGLQGLTMWTLLEWGSCNCNPSWHKKDCAYAPALESFWTQFRGPICPSQIRPVTILRPGSFLIPLFIPIHNHWIVSISLFTMPNGISKRQQLRNEKALAELIRTVPGNDRCADCEALTPGSLRLSWNTVGGLLINQYAFEYRMGELECMNMHMHLYLSTLNYWS